MTWDEITELEPELAHLLLFAKWVKDDKQTPYFCANEIWYRLFKPRLMQLVGWEAANPVLAGETEYDTAYDMIYDTLPGCRNCGCM